MPLSHVLHVSTECEPLAKAGGLADVVAALPRALRRIEPGLDVSLVMPRYGGMSWPRLARAGAGSVRVGGARLGWEAWRVDAPTGFPVRLVDSEVFAAPDVYPFERVLERQAVLCDAATSLARASRGPGAGMPPVSLVHAHDHHAALAVAWLRHGQPRVPTVFTVHNARYGGEHAWEAARGLDLPADLPEGACDHDGRFNALKTALSCADAITTVSPSHARELLERPYASMGLEYAFREAAPRLTGILNGIDTEAWDPRRDPLLPARFDEDHLEARGANKAATCAEHGLDPRKPLLAVVGRLVPEKGLDVLVEAMPQLAAREPDVQLLVLGSGEARYAEALRRLERDVLPGRVRVALRHDEALAHAIPASADVVLVPSWYEPCGLVQMYAMRYGAVPVVFPTGGLRDSVVPFDESTGTGTGLWMERHDAPALVDAVAAALGLWRRAATWRILQLNGMRADYSWDAPAGRYLEIYRRVVEASS